MKALPGNQFPLEGYDNFTKQNVPRWTTTDEPYPCAPTSRLVDKVCPRVVGSRLAGRALRVPRGAGAARQGQGAGAGRARGWRPMAEAAKLKGHADRRAVRRPHRAGRAWPGIKATVLKFLDQVRRRGQPEVIDLPAIGIRGNSHMLMMDRNNREVAAVIQQRLAAKGLYR